MIRRFAVGVVRFFIALFLISAEYVSGQGESQLEQVLAQMNPPVAMDPVRGYRSRSVLEFPDGSSVVNLSLAAKKLVIKDADGKERNVFFDYGSYPTTIYVIHAGPDGKIYGSSDHPSYMFVYDPVKDELMFYPDTTINFKALRTQGQYIFGGHYSGGIFWLLDTSMPITLPPAPCIQGNAITLNPPAKGAAPNPMNLGKFQPTINIPRGAFAHPDGKHIMICGQPGYGFVGGGLIIYNLETKKMIVLNHKQLLADYSTMAIAALPDGSLLCGTSPKGGHGTVPVHTSAQLYVLDWPTKKVVWQSGPLEKTRDILSLLAGPDGCYYYVTGAGVFVAFTIESRAEEAGLTNILSASESASTILAEPVLAPRIKVEMKQKHYADLSEYGSHLLTQAMIIGPDGKIYLALSGALLRITPGTYEKEVLAKPNGGISAGIGIVNGRIYFASSGRLMSIANPAPGNPVNQDGIMNHGAPVQASENRGMTVAVDGAGNRRLLIWLMNGGTDQMLTIDVDTGETLLIPVEPFAGDNAFSVWHSKRGFFYSHYGSHFYEFDPKTLCFTFAARTAGRCAMSMHEDKQGIIWAALYPGAGLVSFNPVTRELTDHGSVHKEAWGQYTSYMASDDAGWIYVGIGNTLGQLVGYNPGTGEHRDYVLQQDRRQGVGHPFSATDGKVYATAPNWSAHEMFAGEATPIESVTQRHEARLDGCYEPDKGDYFIPARVFRNWELIAAATNVVDELIGTEIKTQPAVAWAPSGVSAEASRWLWKNDLNYRFELLIRARGGPVAGELRVLFNDQELFKAPTPFKYDDASVLVLPVPDGALKEKENFLTISFKPDEEAALPGRGDASVKRMNVYYAVFKRLGRK